MSLELQRAADRYVTREEGRTTRHSFSFGRYYDPANLGFATMIALNDEYLPPGTGYAAHRHSDTEIVTWVLAGALRHTDANGNSGVLLPGDVQRISAGTGIVHAELAEPGNEPGNEPGLETRFLQTWLRPDQAGAEPQYAIERGAVPPSPDQGLHEAVGPGGLSIGTAGARLLIGTPRTDTDLPDVLAVHLFVVAGRFRLGELELGPGDSARGLDEAAASLQVIEPGPIALWAFGV